MASSDKEFERKCAAIAISPMQLKSEIPLLRNEEEKRLGRVCRVPGTFTCTYMIVHVYILVLCLYRVYMIMSW